MGQTDKQTDKQTDTTRYRVAPQLKIYLREDKQRKLLCEKSSANGVSVRQFWRKTTFDGGQPLTEDDIWRKTNFDGRQPLTEDNLGQKITFDGGQALTEDNLWRKTNFDGRQHLMEEKHWEKMTFDKSQPLTKDYFWRKTTFDWRQHLIEAQWKTFCTLTKRTRRWTYSALRYFFCRFRNGWHFSTLWQTNICGNNYIIFCS